MTRINAMIDVKRLTDEHLLAEHREIKRLPFCLREAIRTGSVKHIPEKFTLGKGHVLFFMDKMRYTLNRYFKIYHELRRRGYNVINYASNWNNVPRQYLRLYMPLFHFREKMRVRKILTERIAQRIMDSEKAKWHYYREPITKDTAIKILGQG